MITIPIPGYNSPPIRSNDRDHWAVKARKVREFRATVATAARGRRTPIDYPVTVTMVWAVTDKRVRDVGSMAPSCKAAIDGLVDAHVIVSDRHTIVAEERYRIEVGAVKGVRLEIRAVGDDQDADLRPLVGSQADSGASDVEPDAGNTPGRSQRLAKVRSRLSTVPRTQSPTEDPW